VPPSYGVYEVEPRSLRNFAVEWPEELPHYLKKDISVFLDTVQRIDTADVEVAFKEAQARFGLARSHLFPNVRVASSPGSPYKHDILQGDPLNCSENIAGFELALSFQGTPPVAAST
jgi:hypothetical protein